MTTPRDDPAPKNDRQARPRAGQGRPALNFALGLAVGALVALASVVIVYLVRQWVASGRPIPDALVGTWELDRDATVQVNPHFRCYPEMVGYEVRNNGDGAYVVDGGRKPFRWTLLDKPADNELLLEAAFEGSTEALRVGVILLDNDRIRLAYMKSGLTYALKRSATGHVPAPMHVMVGGGLDTGLDGSQLDKGVYALAVSADGRVVVAQGRGPANKVVVWDVEQTRPLHEFPNPSSRDRPVAVSADGTVLAYPTGQRGVEGVVLRDVESGKELRRLKRKDGAIRVLSGLAFSPADDLLVAAADGEVVGWDPRTGEQRFVWEGDDDLVTALSAFFEAGKKIASGGQGGTVKVWDVATGRVVCTLAEERARPAEASLLPYGSVRSIAASEDGKMLVSAAYTDLSAPSEPIAVWDVAAGKVVKRLPARGSTRLALLPDGNTLVYSNITGVYLEKLETGVRGYRYLLRGHESFVSCLALTPDGSRLVTGGLDKMIKVMDLTTFR